VTANPLTALGGMGRGEHRLPGSQHRVGLTEVDRGWRQQAQAPVVMLFVLLCICMISMR